MNPILADNTMCCVLYKAVSLIDQRYACFLCLVSAHPLAALHGNMFVLVPVYNSSVTGTSWCLEQRSVDMAKICIEVSRLLETS